MEANTVNLRGNLFKFPLIDMSNIMCDSVVKVLSQGLGWLLFPKVLYESKPVHVECALFVQCLLILELQL